MFAIVYRLEARGKGEGFTPGGDINWHCLASSHKGDAPAGLEEMSCYEVNCLWTGPHGRGPGGSQDLRASVPKPESLEERPEPQKRLQPARP